MSGDDDTRPQGRQCRWELFNPVVLAEYAVMNVELLVVPDCPHQVDAEALLYRALHDVGLSRVPSVTTVIRTDAEAQRRGFLGSPTVLIDGIDPFASDGQPPSLACRIYQNPNGPSGIPDLRDLRRALKETAHRNLQTTGSP
jgi:hypothetical protein